MLILAFFPISQSISYPTSAAATAKKEQPNVPVLSPLEKRLLDIGPIREDGSDKFYGMENVSCVSWFALRARYANHITYVYVVR